LPGLWPDNPPNFQKPTGLCFAAQARSSVHESDRIQDIKVNLAATKKGEACKCEACGTVVLENEGGEED